jgi:hypothetical protein
MEIVDRNIDAPTKMAYYFGIMPNAIGTSAIVEAVQEYLAGLSKECISSLQKIDAGWAPFDADQRPLPITCTLDVRCIRDEIHCHCMSLSETGVAPTPDLVELDEFFLLATEMIENCERAALQARAPAIRAPAVPSHRDVLANWME